MKRTLISALALAAGLSAHAQYSAWLPGEQQFVLTPGATFSTFDRFWLGKDNVRNPGDDSLDQFTTYLALEYGFTKKLAGDLTIGYTGVDTDSFGHESDWGSSDTTFGLRYRLWDEHEHEDCWMPTIAVRVGGIIAGSYDENFPFSAGDGAGGFEGSLLFAREICPNSGIYGDVGYRFRENDVPDDLFGSVGVYGRYAGFTATIAYRHVQGTSGGDIGGPGFGTSYGFPQVKEINQIAELGLGYTCPRTDIHAQVFYAHSLDGRNTGQKDIYGFSVSFPFGGK